MSLAKHAQPSLAQQWGGRCWCEVGWPSAGSLPRTGLAADRAVSRATLARLKALSAAIRWQACSRRWQREGCAVTFCDFVVGLDGDRAAPLAVGDSQQHTRAQQSMMTEQFNVLGKVLEHRKEGGQLNVLPGGRNRPEAPQGVWGSAGKRVPAARIKAWRHILGGQRFPPGSWPEAQFLAEVRASRICFSRGNCCFARGVWHGRGLAYGPGACCHVASRAVMHPRAARI